MWKKLEEVHSKVESENVHNMQIVQELKTNKPIFPSSTQRISTKLHILLHTSVFSLLIISVFIPLVVHNIHWKGYKQLHPGDFNTVQNILKYSNTAEIFIMHTFQHGYFNTISQQFLM